MSRVGLRAKTLISPELQEEEIRRWAEGRDVALEILPAELDQSGAKDDRPILLAAIERIEAGDLDGIVVWNYARFARSLASSLAFAERIESIGGELHSTSQQVDVSTPSGRMTRNFLFSIAQAEREERAEGFERAKASAIERGIWSAPHVPFGYRKREDRRLEVDPVEGPIRAELIRRRARGESWRSLEEFVRERTGRAFTLSALRAMVRSRLNIGEISQGEHRNPDGVEPIIDRATYEAAMIQQPKPPRSDREPALLAKLIRCAGCSRTVSTRIHEGRRFYECRRHHRAGTCPAPASANAEIEDYVVEVLFDSARCLPINARARDAAIAEAERRLEVAEEELRVYQETVRVSEIGAENFQAGMRARVAAVDQARRELAAAKLAAPVFAPETLEEIWPDLSVGERGQVLRSTFSVVWLRGRARDGIAIADRARVIKAGYEPPGLSGSGRAAGELVSLNWDADLDGEVRIPSPQDGGEAASGA